MTAFAKAAPLGCLLALAALPALAADGAEVFSEACAACHNEGGIGNPGLAPALNRPGFWSALGEDAVPYVSGVMTSGLAGMIQAGGQTYAGLIMPPVAGYDDDALAAAASYVLQELGGLGTAVTAADVAAAREAHPSHSALRAMRPAAE
ncbi:c-type cytochrome [Poseidonocella sp. HB161398]|uniref:c-type cytochrome n=1 Tax=Poseidonocella sp. HB161398 TaxID=2320855 RepID=UPI001108553C|nr:c-type cytochrome [Poseidonocella sp. HB161398]